MLVEEQIQARQERAKQAIQKITSRPPKSLFGDYVVRSTSGKSYRVAMRGPGLFDNYCACPDFAVNTLGTCKHIESLLQRLRRRGGQALRRQDFQRSRASISLRYGETVEVRLRIPEDASPGLRRVAGRYFDSVGILRDGRYMQFGKLLDELRRVDESAVVYSDVIEYVDRLNEFDDGLAFERERVRELEAGRLPLDNLLKQPLFPYQMRGALFAASRGRVILADDMGLGKTIQTIAAVELLRQRRGIQRVLVIAPTSVKYQWKTEIEKFCDLSVQVIDGLHPQRRKLYERPAFFNLINYELILKHLERVQALGADVIVLDEAQRIRNWTTATSRCVKQLKSRYAIVLTGTPLENKLEELYSVVEFVDGRLLGPSFRFLKEHVVTTEKGKLLGYRGLGEVRERLQPILLRRTRGEVLRELPQRTDQIFRVPMTKEQAEPYWEQSEILARLMHKWERQGWLSEIDLRRITCCIQNMRMLCNSTFLFDKATNVSPKLDEFREIIRELTIEEGRKVVVFSEYERMTRLAGEVLKKLKIDFVSLHGQVPARKRGGLIKRFREDADCKVFFSTDAGGVGLNLQAASAVINFEPPWNPARLEQRIGRVHRMGQMQPVQVIHMLTENSIEERVWETIRLKKALFAGVFESGEDEISFEKLGRKSMMESLKEVFAERAEDDGGGARDAEEQVSSAAVEPPAESGAPPVVDSPADTSTPAAVAAPSAASAPPADPAQAMAALIEAGVRFLEALSPRAAGTDSAVAPTGHLDGSPNDLVSNIMRTDSKTGRPILSIPLPETVTAERIATAIGGFLRAFQERR